MDKKYLDVVYEDMQLLVVNKPEGIPSAILKTGSQSMTELVLALRQECLSLGAQKEFGLVHRLDTGTSGLLIFAKSSFEWLRLKSLFRQHQVKKIYRAMTDGNPAFMRDWIMPFELVTFLGHDQKSKKKMKAALYPAGKNYQHYLSQIRGKPHIAKTLIRRIDQLSNQLYDIELEIITGVMHQIRCQLAYFGCPLIGDIVYKGKPYPQMLLHAWQLEFLTSNQQWLKLEAPLPLYFRDQIRLDLKQ